ncbi:hypothetical protein [Oceanirhabdus seepicola]|uniref:Tetrachloroethene dehalogenase n=1 Tax=Oceanirhabdus seepicola TaxID=2828781 RepID=A0A9J6P6P2_9CLOT|nr:hypothetical protein [Oceanirhabdus seepicola]MCM1991766.1 hypothetical protein [Oceanirhabdus seepicola]
MHTIVSLFKWVLGLHQLAWFVAGAVSFAAITYFYKKLKEVGRFNKGSYTFVVLSSLTVAFTILWTYDSYLENEVRAANMGILIFGGLAVVFAIIAHRLAPKKKVSKVTTEHK